MRNSRRAGGGASLEGDRVVLERVNRADAEIKSRAVFRRIKQPLGLASAILVLALFGVLSYDNISHFAQKYEGPFECDEFGYLRQARLFQERGFFGGLDTAIQDATTSYLVAKAKALTPPVPEWSQIVAPDCHHFKKATDRVILQYPPGTGLLLSFFSEGYQEHGAFNLVCAVLVAGLAMVALASANVTTSFLVAILGAFCLQGLRQFDISFSIPGSVLLLVVLAWLTAGAMAMKPAQWRWPLHALMGFVLGVSVNFRVANCFLVFGFAAAYGALIKRHCFLVFRFAAAYGALIKRPTRNTLAAPTAFAAAFLIGAAPILAANAINAGSIFSTTYDTYDTMPPSLSWDILKRSLYFYFVSHDGTRFFLAAIVAFVIFIASHWFTPIRGFGTLAIIMSVNLVSNTAYFLTHDVLIGHYLLPLSAFTIALSIFALVQAGYGHAGIGLPRPASPAATFLAASAFVFALVVMVRLVPIAVFPSHIRNDLTFNLEPQSVVWGGSHSGFFHYFRGHQAARIHYAPEELQDRLIGAIAADRVSQIFVLDSDRLKPILNRIGQTWSVRKVGSAFGFDAFSIGPDHSPPP